MNPRLQLLAMVLHGYIDDTGMGRDLVADYLDEASRLISDPGGLADLDTDEFQQLAGAAFWFLLEGERDEAEAAQAFFRALADAATLARNARLDKFVKYGEVKIGGPA